MPLEELEKILTRTKETMKKAKEGKKLFDSPTFVDIGNGRLRCVETGHEVLAGDKESYSCNKRCRLGLIDYALAQGRSPLNMFSQCPVSRSKLVCKLTGDTVNKNEEHIWKHMNGRRFLHKLEQVGLRAGSSGKTEETQVTKPRCVKEDTDSDSESDFWMVKSSSDSDSSDEENCKGSKESEELSERTKRMSLEIGPSSFASRKKKIRNN